MDNPWPCSRSCDGPAVDRRGGRFVVEVNGPSGPHTTRTCDVTKYLILIYGDEQQWDGMSARDRQELEAAHEAFRAAAGPGLLGGHELEASSTSTTLRSDATGRPPTTDGPFLEAKK